jgi:hypothetical protein
VFPCWTLDELSVAAHNDPGVQLDLDEVADQFHQFGGIIRHVLATKEQRASFVFKDDQTNKISGCDPSILRAVSTGIDSDPMAKGKNVGRYLLSYCNIETTGPKRFWFSNAELDFTSDDVKRQIRIRLNDHSGEEHVEIVVDHLNGKQTDHGGLHLQEAVTSCWPKAAKWHGNARGPRMLLLQAVTMVVVNGCHCKSVRKKCANATIFPRSFV